jgi:hypothetical protein
MPITALPALDRTSATFRADVDTFFGTQLPAFATEANALETNVNAKEVTASAAAVTATTQAGLAADQVALATAQTGLATTQANNAAASALTAVNAPGTSATSTTSAAIGTGSKSLTIQTGKSLVAGMWIIAADTAAPDTNYMAGAIASYDSGTGALVFTASVTGGSGTKTAWTVSLTPIGGLTAAGTATLTNKTIDVSLNTFLNLPAPSLIRSARTANTILGSADKTNLIDITSGTFSQTFDAAATLGDGWFCYIRNGGTGDITLDPNASETIDGLTTFVMYPGEVRLIQCDGSVLRSIVITPFNRTFTTTDTFIKPPSYGRFGYVLWSGGSSGQKSGGTGTGSNGGSGGGCFSGSIESTTLGTSETITIGAGGVAVTTTAVGNVGGNTSIGASVTVYASNNALHGGSVVSGLIGSTTAPDPSGYEGAASGTTPKLLSSVWGGAAAKFTVNSGGSLYGGAAGGSVDVSEVIRSPGVSKFGGNGGAALSTTSGITGVAPGGGGGATQTGTSSGAGARGEVRIWGLV